MQQPTKAVRVAVNSIRSALGALDDEERTAAIKILGLTRYAGKSSTLQREQIEKALADNDGKMDFAAMVLKVSRRTLQSRMRQLDMERGRPGHKVPTKVEP